MERCKDIERRREVEAKLRLIKDTIEEIEMILYDYEEDTAKLLKEINTLEAELDRVSRKPA